LFEPRTGKSYALNTGIASTNGDLVGFIDDDEQIDASWYIHLLEAFRDPLIDFIGGPYLPRWSTAAPIWLPRQAKGVIGWFEFSSTPKKYGKDLPDAVLFGGNAVIRRSALNHVGPYRTDLDMHADQDMFDRLLAAGAQGTYLPKLVIYHFIPRERLQKRYFKRWVWGAGPTYVNMYQRSDSSASIARIPRHLFKKMFQSLLRTSWRSVVPGHQVSKFEAELDLIYSVSLAHAHFRLRKRQSV
jgi:glucosyl-dolichyl phosphate glucuronosyltransferase